MTPVEAVFRYHTEWIDGREVEKPMPKKPHARLQSKLIRLLGAWTDTTVYEALAEQNVVCGADRLVPDITVALSAAPDHDGDLKAEDILLAVEIASPGQTFAELLSKCDRLHAAGAPCCWILLPEKRKAFFYQRGEGLPEEVSTLKVLGHSIQVAELFA